MTVGIILPFPELGEMKGEAGAYKALAYPLYMHGVDLGCDLDASQWLPPAAVNI